MPGGRRSGGLQGGSGGTLAANSSPEMSLQQRKVRSDQFGQPPTTKPLTGGASHHQRDGDAGATTVAPGIRAGPWRVIRSTWQSAASSPRPGASDSSTHAAQSGNLENGKRGCCRLRSSMVRALSGSPEGPLHSARATSAEHVPSCAQASFIMELPCPLRLGHRSLLVGTLSDSKIVPVRAKFCFAVPPRAVACRVPSLV